jgi:DNA end-binding protein Ku
MERTGRVGIGSFVMRDHEYLVAIVSEGGVLRAETLRFHDELHAPDDIGLPKRKKASATRVKALSKEIDALTRDELDAHELSDQYAAAIEELAERKEKQGKDVVHVTGAEDEDAEPGTSNVIDLMSVLRRSLSAKATVTTADKSVEGGAAEPAKEQGAHKKAAARKAPKKRSTTARKATKSGAAHK